jgi:hypothetical protein
MEGLRITMENLKQDIRCYAPNSILMLSENKFRAFTSTSALSVEISVYVRTTGNIFQVWN